MVLCRVVMCLVLGYWARSSVISRECVLLYLYRIVFLLVSLSLLLISDNTSLLSLPLVLPPVLVPRNPNPISRTYEPVPSYLDQSRASGYPNNDLFPLETPGTYIVTLVIR